MDFSKRYMVKNRIKAEEKHFGKVKKNKCLKLSSFEIMTFKLTANTKIVTLGRALDGSLEKLLIHN